MSSGFSVANNTHLIRSNLWTAQLKDLFLDDLYGMKFVNTITDFPDGTTWNKPVVGEAEIQNFVEGEAIKYTRMDTGNFTFSFDMYQYSAHSITKKFKRDSFWGESVESMFVPKEHRALMEAVEARIFNRANAGQTASDSNTINTANHRMVGSGTNETISPTDFSRARFALTKANVPKTNLVAIVDPSVTFALETQTNFVNFLSPMPSGERIVREGMVSGLQFKYNLFGFDIYESNYLPGSIAETVGGRTTTTGVANLFFSAAPGDTLPLIGAFRQMPTVSSKENIDLQQDEYVTICEYGFKLYRPENMVIVLTDTDQVA